MVTSDEWGTPEPAHYAPEYTVPLADRIAELFLPEVLTPDMTLRYEWDHGAERVSVKHDRGGNSEYRGSHHPNVVCESGLGADWDRSGFVCRWCGSTCH